MILFIKFEKKIPLHDNIFKWHEIGFNATQQKELNKWNVMNTSTSAPGHSQHGFPAHSPTGTSK